MKVFGGTPRSDAKYDNLLKTERIEAPRGAYDGRNEARRGSVGRWQGELAAAVSEEGTGARLEIFGGHKPGTRGSARVGLASPCLIRKLAFLVGAKLSRMGQAKRPVKKAFFRG